MTELEAFAAAERPLIEAALERAVAALEAPPGAAALYSIRAGGKRLRPLLTVAAFRSMADAADPPDGPPPAAAQPIHRIAAAVELIHTYSLLHDDLPSMDDDPVRRGLPTAHRVYGVTAATAAGAALQMLAFGALADAAAEDPTLEPVLPELVRRLATAAGSEGMVGGQYLDLVAEGRAPDAAGLEAIHRAKTAALIAAACALGGLAAAADPAAVAALAAYGRELGLAFQIVDDLLDETGDPARTGKAAGADRARAKATYPAVHGIAGARQRADDAARAARAELERLPRPAPVLDACIEFVLERLH